MLCQITDKIKFTADRYIKFSDFTNLYESCKDIIKMLDTKHNEIYNSYKDQYLLATIVGCIEGNIQIDVHDNSWHFWLGQYEASCKLDGNYKTKYMLLSIYGFVKNHIEYYDFIVKYYNLWHEIDCFDNPEFVYDEYHIQDIQKNFNQLICIIDEDVEKARNPYDYSVVETYKTIYVSLMRLFNNC